MVEMLSPLPKDVFKKMNPRGHQGLAKKKGTWKKKMGSAWKDLGQVQPHLWVSGVTAGPP